jgi:hypothetical protein
VQPAQRYLIGIGIRIGIGIDKDMTSGREKPDVDWVDVDWADVDWADVDWALPSKNMNQISFCQNDVNRY